MHPSVRRQLATRYHDSLPADIRRSLNDRGISDRTIQEKLLGWTGTRIAIPVFGRHGEIVQFRYLKSPHDTTPSPAALTEIGGNVELYGWETLGGGPQRVVICARELDRLLLESRGIPAVTSTGGAHVFLRDWTPYFDAVKYVYVCFDRDARGEIAAENVKAILPKAKVVRLPGVGIGGTITDYFVRLGYGIADFEIVLAVATTADENNSSAR